MLALPGAPRQKDDKLTVSETASTIIKLLSSLVSPKTCVKYLAVACSLVFSWIYVGEFIKNLEKRGVSISDQQSDIVILLIGVGLGGLLGFLIVAMFEAGHNKITSLQQAKILKIEAEESKAKKERDNQSFVNDFIGAIDHLKASQVRVLRKLTIGRANIDFIEGENGDLAKNKYIQRVSCVHGSTYITEINPLLKNYVVEHWKSDIDSRIERMFTENPFANELLELLETQNSDSTNPVKTGWFQYLSVYSSTCLHGEYERNPNDAERVNYELWFGEYDEDVIEELERRNDKSYNGNLVIAHNRLQNSA